MSYAPKPGDGVDPRQRPATRNENEVTDPKQLTSKLWVILIRRPRGELEVIQRAEVVEMRRKGSRGLIQHVVFRFPSQMIDYEDRMVSYFLADFGVIPYKNGTWNQNNSIEIDGNQDPTPIPQ